MPEDNTLHLLHELTGAAIDAPIRHIGAAQRLVNLGWVEYHGLSRRRLTVRGTITLAALNRLVVHFVAGQEMAR